MLLFFFCVWIALCLKSGPCALKAETHERAPQRADQRTLQNGEEGAAAAPRDRYCSVHGQVCTTQPAPSWCLGRQWGVRGARAQLAQPQSLTPKPSCTPCCRANYFGHNSPLRKAEIGKHRSLIRLLALQNTHLSSMEREVFANSAEILRPDWFMPAEMRFRNARGGQLFKHFRGA